jgi:hypothetical protein
MFARNSELKVLTVQRAMLAVNLAIAMLGAACGSGGAEGKYRDSRGTFNTEFKDGKATIAISNADCRFCGRFSSSCSDFASACPFVDDCDRFGGAQ